MIKRFGSTGLATILGIGGLFAVGVGSFAAYKSYTGCGACCASKDGAMTTPVALVEGADACCSAEKAAACEGEAKAACATSEACCKGKDAADCCKSGEKSECSEKAVEGDAGAAEPTAAAEKKASCPLCPSKTKG